MITSKIVRFLAAAALAVGFSTAAHAQTRTFVSGTGSDANPCSRTAPCQTFAGAFSKTATNGEISALDPGGFGTINITKSITINGDGTLASILASGVTGVIVNITTNLATDKVLIRNISINGAGTGTDGVRFIDGAEVILDDVKIHGFTDAGVDVTQSQASSMFMKNVRISKAAVGVRTQSTLGTVVGNLENVYIEGMTSHGVEAVNNTLMVHRNVEVSRSGGSGVRSAAASNDLSIMNSVASFNVTGYQVVAGTIRIANCGMFYNTTNLTGNVSTGGDNRSGGNTITNVPAAGGMTVN